jgi:hypothetical protein
MERVDADEDAATESADATAGGRPADAADDEESQARLGDFG